jgi:hypothetical protein
MLSLIAASGWLGIEGPDMGKLYLVIALIVVLFFALAIVRGVGRLREQGKEKKSAWRTFEKLSKARGLLPAEAEVLALATKKAKIKRPSQVLAAIQVFDKCVNNFIEYEEVSALQQAHLVSARQKLVSTVEPRSKGEERRQLARASAALPIQIHLIAKDWVDEETKGLNRGGRSTAQRGLGGPAGRIGSGPCPDSGYQRRRGVPVHPG